MGDQVARTRASRPLGAIEDRGWIKLDRCHFALARDIQGQIILSVGVIAASAGQAALGQQIASFSDSYGSYRAAALLV